SLTHLFSASHRENRLTRLFSSTHWEHFFCPFVFNNSLGATFIFNISFIDPPLFSATYWEHFILPFVINRLWEEFFIPDLFQAHLSFQQLIGSESYDGTERRSATPDSCRNRPP
ncbi:MAG: hypothetical protein P4N24_17270, partial [Acidobacteriota bacterium]|nr:hypothetical protein [Acidobacteriota bacterium]